MKRVMVTLSKELSRKLVARAKAERRSISACAALIIENDINQTFAELRAVENARSLGLDPVEILTTAAEQKLTSEATA